MTLYEKLIGIATAATAILVVRALYLRWRTRSFQRTNAARILDAAMRMIDRRRV